MPEFANGLCGPLLGVCADVGAASGHGEDEPFAAQDIDSPQYGVTAHIVLLLELLHGRQGTVAPIQVNDMVAEDDRVVVYWTMVGTHLGEGAGVAPTGRTITFTAISQLRFRDGKLIEYQVSPDRLEIFQQMGVIPALD